MKPERPASLPPIEVLDRSSAEIFAATMAPLFEGAPRFLGRLAGARPFGTLDALFERSRRIAHAMPEAEQLELIGAHPRLGAPPADVSALSFVEQGYDHVAAARTGGELDHLNEAYEEQFGFRYCVFVDGRSRAELLPGIAAALETDRQAEIERALDAVIDIARDRAGRLSAPAGRGEA